MTIWLSWLTASLWLLWSTTRAIAFTVIPRSTTHRSATSPFDSSSKSSSEEVRLVFPGGGLFFYWQAGVISYLRQEGYDLSVNHLSGASAGALTATLTATGVDFEEATRVALDLSKKAGIWDRGLQGIWGPLIREWLEILLPHNATKLVNDNKLSLLVTPVPSFGKTRISTFLSKQDLIDCNMASIHLPWFLNGHWTCNFRGQACIDGSFLAQSHHYRNGNPDASPSSLSSTNDHVVWINPTRDPEIRALEFVKLISKDGIWDLLARGKEYAQRMEQDGEFDKLIKRK